MPSDRCRITPCCAETISATMTRLLPLPGRRWIDVSGRDRAASAARPLPLGQRLRGDERRWRAQSGGGPLEKPSRRRRVPCRRLPAAHGLEIAGDAPREGRILRQEQSTCIGKPAGCDIEPSRQLGRAKPAAAGRQGMGEALTDRADVLCLALGKEGFPQVGLAPSDQTADLAQPRRVQRRHGRLGPQQQPLGRQLPACRDNQRRRAQRTGGACKHSHGPAQRTGRHARPAQHLPQRRGQQRRGDLQLIAFPTRPNSCQALPF